ncbi:MerR family transcriptional regulator [Paeniglutamicibacter gangotriensis]|uniref:MerR family transcriptional regulator n=1 Tax=Paeniglutamicibacter gangotriensis Lz1y TaxID=1276920 RepID=M7MQS3_9MICC|nr:MerR family transcriptional regulator [Paeniglutamicibacter gangotriensis]EMQ97406.1 MerR family transcriptional regulator [Paeniglutamicibacter gangotriensis Lz1y]
MTDIPPPADEGQRMHIGDLAEATGLSQRTIRHYDEVGLLPATTRSVGGFRIYTDSDLQRMLVIRSMKPLGFTLEEMGELLDTVDTLASDTKNAEARARLADFIDQANAKRDKLALNLSRADAFIQDLQGA